MEQATQTEVDDNTPEMNNIKILKRDNQIENKLVRKIRNLK